MEQNMIKNLCEDIQKAQKGFQDRLKEVEAYGKTIKEILKKEQELSVFTKEELKKREDDLDTLQSQLKNHIRKYEADKTYNTPEGFAQLLDKHTYKDQDLLGVAKSMIRDPYSEEYKKAFEGVIRGSNANEMDKAKSKLFDVTEKIKDSNTNVKDSFIKKELTSGSGSGAFLCPPEYDYNIMKQLRETSPLEQVCETMIISKESYVFFIENKIPMATHDETELNDPKNSDVQNYSVGRISLNKAYAEPKLPLDLLSDSVVDVEGKLREGLAQRFMLLQNKMFIKGSGAKGEPRGLQWYAERGKQNPNYDEPLKINVFEQPATTLASEDSRPLALALLDMEAELISGYKQGAVWLIHRKNKNRIRKIVDKQGQFLFSTLQGWGGFNGVPQIKDGRDGMINGYPVLECDDLDDDLTAGKYPIFFGNWRNFKVVKKMGMTMLIDPFTLKEFIKYYTTIRYGCGLTQGRGIIALKVT